MQQPRISPEAQKDDDDVDELPAKNGVKDTKPVAAVAKEGESKPNPDQPDGAPAD